MTSELRNPSERSGPRFAGMPAQSTLLTAGLVVATSFVGILVEPFLLIVTVFVAGSYYAYQRRVVDETKDDDQSQPPLDKDARQYGDVPDAMRDVSDRYHSQAIWYFFRLLCELPDFLTLADERATVEQFGLRLETRLVFRVTDGESPTVLVPFLQVSKGSLVDELEVVSGQHNSVPVLSPYETRGLIGWALNCVVGFAWAQTHRAGPRAHLDKTSVEELLRIVCRPDPWDDDEGLHDKLDTAVRALDLSEGWRNRVYRLCLGLAQSELLVAEVDRPNVLQLDLTYRQLLAYESTRAQKIWRIRLGLLQDTVDAPPMVYASRAQSYHFQLSPVPGRYVHQHVIAAVGSRASASTRDLEQNLHGPLDRRKKKEGVRSHAHCYIAPLESPRARRSATDNPVQDYKSVVKFREVPPGALGGVTLISSSVALTTTFFALSRVGLGGAEAEVNADVPALVIALPAFTAILVGHWSDMSRLPKSSVSAYVGLLGTMLISLLSVLVFLLDSDDRLDWAGLDRETCCGITIATSWPWLLLAAAAWTQTLYLWLRLQQGIRRYRFLQEAGIDKIPERPGASPEGAAAPTGQSPPVAAE